MLSSFLDARRSRRCSAVLTVAMAMLTLLGACRDPLYPHLAAPRALPADGHEAAVVIASVQGSDLHTVHVRWRSGEQAPPIAGFRATLMVPPGLEVVGDVEAQTDAQGDLLRVVHDQRDRVLASGLSTQGFVMGDLFTVRLRGAADRLRLLRLALDEVVDQRGRDRRVATQVREVRQ
jgi:hypothetical protein